MWIGFDNYLTADQLTGHFNAVPLHGRPMMKNLLANSLYKTVVSDSGPEHEIETTYEPIVILNDVSKLLCNKAVLFMFPFPF